VFGFLGPNGAGKTTTLGILTTLVEPTAGTATILGTPVSDRDAVTEHIGYLPETPPLYDGLTGREQLMHVARLRNLPSATAAERIDASLSRFDLADAATDRIDTYSTGMRRKLGIIQAMLHEPDVLLLDEPMGGLDPNATRDLQSLLSELAADGVTVVLSTHVLPIAAEISDTVGVLADGRFVAEGPPEDVTARMEGDGDESLEDVFVELTTGDAR
jgi:ABC-2 type transport system ATP-binding protein